MSSSFQVEPKQLGTILKNEIFSSDGVIGENITLEYYFTVEDDAGFFTEIALKGFEDDLDLTLSQSNNGFYLPISDSELSGVEEEYIGKFLPAGDYLVEVSYYESLSDTLDTPFNLTFDTKSFYDNTLLPNDPLFDNQWHLFNKGQGKGIENEDIFAPEGWKIRSTSPGVVVAVIDGGVDLNHEDLDDNLWVNAGEIPNNGLDDDGNDYADDYHGWNFANKSLLNDASNHGTHVAGTIGAEGNNGIGVTGVTWDVKLMSLDVFGGPLKGSFEPIWSAIRYAADNGADVINMSLGAGRNLSVDEYIKQEPDNHKGNVEALTYAVEKGVTVVIAAGNSNNNFDDGWISTPAYLSGFIPGVISVAATANTGQKAYYTNYGSEITISAPGGDFYSSGEFDDTSTLFATSPIDPEKAPPGEYQIDPMYGYMQGTSMAAPVVTGAIALMLGENPYLNPAQVESVLQNTAFKDRSLEGIVQNGANLNLEGALQASQELVEKTVVRLYNSSSGKHLFSSNENEIDILVGSDWENEGALYYTPEEATADVFRFYISEENRHFYTALESEKDMIIGNKDIFSGWEYEGGAFSSYSTSDFSDDAVAVVRYLNEESGNHVYSTSTLEQGILDQDGNWINEGIAWYGDSFSTASNFI